MSFSGDTRREGTAPANTAPQDFQFNMFGTSRGTSGLQSPNSQNYHSPSSAHSMASGQQRLSAGSPAQTEQTGADRTANLLQLLKFGTSAASPMGSAQPPTQQNVGSFGQASSFGGQNIRGPGVSSDLVASFMGKGSTLPENSSPSPVPSAPSTTHADSNYLLHLLNSSIENSKSRASSSPKPPPLAEAPVQNNGTLDIQNLVKGLAKSSLKEHTPNGSHRGESPIRVFGSKESREVTPFDPVVAAEVSKAPKAAQPIFTYVNPFEQLAASSPRHTKGSNTPSNPVRMKQGHDVVQKATVQGGSSDEASRYTPDIAHRDTRRKLTGGGKDILQSIESSTPTDTGSRTQVETLMDIGAPTNNVETVAQALNQVGEQVSRQVDHKLSQATEQEEASPVKRKGIEAVILEKNGLTNEPKIKLEEEIEEIKLADIKPEPLLNPSASNGFQADLSADDEKSPVKDDAEDHVPVYNFPLKPFVSIQLTPSALPERPIRQTSITDIARLKKEFDQIDRTLATASNEFIAYSMPRSGGLRIIRQEDGADLQVLKDAKDHIFNIAISSAPGGTAEDTQAFIASAVSGAVVWGAISHGGTDIIQQEDPKSLILTFPPTAAHDEHTSGGQLKTRARKSNRHPQFFGIGRGKRIQIIFPFHARNSNLRNKDGVVDVAKYFKERSLFIDTGKAGKDFVFSEDDTVVASLDKAGKLRFWNVTELVDEENGYADTLVPVEVKDPLMSFSTALPHEKSWPTMVMFVDKLRPYAKCGALRYVIVGMKQNHSLQLWDVSLEKAVQELNFPHEHEDDPICSVLYHPGSGILVVGHPSRNSIYFIHVSSPKYNLPIMSQASYLNRLKNKDVTLPKTDSTAIMSGIREYSFAGKGLLRSIDLLTISPERASEDQEDPGLFELYVMHSKGVTCLNVKKADLGWSSESKVLNGVNAQEAGVITVKDLKEMNVVSNVMSEPSSVNGEGTASSVKTPKKKSSASVRAKQDVAKGEPQAQGGQSVLGKEVSSAPETLKEMITPPDTQAASVALIDGQGDSEKVVERSEKKKNKKRSAITTLSRDSELTIPPEVPEPPVALEKDLVSRAKPSQQDNSLFSQSQSPSKPGISRSPSKTKSSVTESVTKGEQSLTHGLLPAETSISLGISADFLDAEMNKIQKAISSEFHKVLGGEMQSLYRRFEDDKRAHDASSAAKQDAVLRLVSATLNDNVDKALTRIVNNSLEKTVVPAILETTASTLDKKVPEWLTKQLLNTLPAQLKLALPEAVSRAVSMPDVQQVLSAQITNKLSVQVEKQFSNLMQQKLIPELTTLTSGIAKKLSTETERQLANQLKVAQAQHKEDDAKIDKLTALVRGLSDTVHTMSTVQHDFQQEILRLQQQLQDDRKTAIPARPAEAEALYEAEAAPKQMTPEARELMEISSLMSEGHFEQGTIRVRSLPAI
jgi:hypothetical protein